MRLRLVLLILLVTTLPAPLYARWIEDKVMMPVDATGTVEFSHYDHIDAVGKNCPTCHNRVFNIVAEKNPVFTMTQMENGKSCGACHNGNKAFSVNDDCSSCHPTRDVAIDVEATGPTLFSHDVHTSMFGCGECHPDIYKPAAGQNPKITMDAMGEGESCGACHDGDTAFGVADDCSSCHPTREITFEVEATGPTLFSHDVHTSMFGCDECHPDIYKPAAGKNPKTSMDAMSEGESCGACHDGDTAFGVADDCSSCHPTREITIPEEDAGDVLFSHEVHTSMFGCSDCHADIFKPAAGKNPKTSMEAMEDGESCGACHDGDSAFSVAEDCEACHQM